VSIQKDCGFIGSTEAKELHSRKQIGRLFDYIVANWNLCKAPENFDWACDIILYATLYQIRPRDYDVPETVVNPTICLGNNISRESVLQ